MCPGHPMLWEISRTRRVLISAYGHDDNSNDIAAWWEDVPMMSEHDDFLEGNTEREIWKGQGHRGKAECASMPVHIVVLFIVTVCHCIHYIVQCKRCKPRSQDTAQPKKEDVTFKRELDIFSHWFGVSDDQQSLIEDKADRDQREYINTTYKRMCPN